MLNVGRQSPLSNAELVLLRQGLTDAVQRSRSRLIDEHTADMIRSTVLDALERSPTFRAAVSYGLRNHEVRLDDITYRNSYESNLHASGVHAPQDIRDQTTGDSRHADAANEPVYPLSSDEQTLPDIRNLTIDDLRNADAANVPIYPLNEAVRGEDSAGGVACIDFSAATDAGSPYMSSWQEGLIHELIHHITGATDPEGTAENQLGPTEILARLVAKEMGWSLPTFRGYGDPARTAFFESA